MDLSGAGGTMEKIRKHIFSGTHGRIFAFTAPAKFSLDSGVLELKCLLLTLLKLDDLDLRFVAIRLNHVRFMDSSALGELTSWHTKLSSKGIQLLLVKPSDKVLQHLEISKLESVFQIRFSRRKRMAQHDSKQRSTV